MSTSLLAFLTLLEDRVLPLLPAAKDWRFQRLVNFRAGEAVLQLWEGETLAGQAELRELHHGGDGPASFMGLVRPAGEGAAGQPFSFRSESAEEVEQQAQKVAEAWHQILPGEEA